MFSNFSSTIILRSYFNTSLILRFASLKAFFSISNKIGANVILAHPIEIMEDHNFTFEDIDNLCGYLKEKGFHRYEVSNFAKDNFYSKHNMNCWEQKEYIGFGLAAHSYINNNRYSNTVEFEEYFDVASDNKIITMQVLTHDVMDMLMSFVEATKIKFDISIYGSQMYFRFYTGEVFELPSLKKGAFDEESLKKYYDVLEFTYILSRKMIELIEEAKI